MKISFMLNLLLWLAAAYLLIALVAYLAQESLIFPRAETIHPTAEAFANERLMLKHQEVTLEGWHLVNTQAIDPRTLIYFGGNAENVASYLPLFKSLNLAHVYTFNYRGYGQSGGKPSEQAIYADATAIVNYVLQQQHITPSELVILGRSLGTAVAGEIATHYAVSQLILVTPLKSAVDNGKRTMPFLPVDWLMKHRFDLAEKAPQIHADSLIIIARNDEVIPVKDSLYTFERLAGNKQKLEINHIGHNNVFDNGAVNTAIARFIHTKTLTPPIRTEPLRQL